MPRLAVILSIALLAGASTGALVWILGGLLPSWRHELQTQASVIPPEPPRVETHAKPPQERALDLAKLLSNASSTVDGAPQPLQLFGVVMAPSARALIGIAGKPPQWFVVGEVRDGNKLIEVGANAVRLDTPAGERIVKLGEQPHAGAIPVLQPVPRR